MGCKQPVNSLSIYGLAVQLGLGASGELRTLENWQIPFAVAKLDPRSHGGPIGTRVHGGKRPLSLVTQRFLKGHGRT